MADKPKDSKAATWVSRRFGAHADVDKMGAAGRAALEVGAMIRKEPFPLIGMPLVMGAIGGMFGLMSASGEAPTVPSPLAYSDTGQGYEVLKYAADRPAVAVVRDGEQVRLYTVAKDRWTLVTNERDAWTIATEAYTALTRNARIMSDPTSTYDGKAGNESFVPEMWRYDSVTKAWQESGGVMQREATGRHGIDTPLPALAQELEGEAAEWAAIRQGMLQKGYAATENPADVTNGDESPTPYAEISTGAGLGGGLGMIFMTGLVGATFAGCYGRQKRKLRR